MNVAAFSPDGEILATVDDEGMLKVWDAATGRLQRETLAHKGDAVIARFTPDGGRIITGGREDRFIRIWDRSSVAMIEALPITDLGAGNGALENAVVSPNGSILATGGVGEVKLWNLAGRTLIAVLPGSRGAQGVAFSHDGTKLATSHESDSMVRLWGVLGGRMLREFRGHSSGAFSVAFSLDDRTLTSAGGDGTIRLWSLADGRPFGVHRGHKDRIWTLAFSPDGRTVASAGADGMVRIWDSERPPDNPRLPILRPASMAFSSDGRTLLTLELGRPCLLSRWDTRSGKLLERRPLDVPRDAWTIFSPDCQSLAMADGSGAITLWSVADGRQKGRIEGVPDTIDHLEFSSDLQYLFVHSKVQGYSLWDVAHSRRVPLPWKRPLCMALTTMEVAAVPRDGHLVWWDPRTGRTRSRAFQKPHRIDWATFSPDGRMLASREPGTHKIHLWSAETLELLQELAGHPVGAGQFDFSPDSRTLASAGAERTVKLWDVATGEEILTLEGYSEYVSIPRFSPDGGSLATYGADADGRLVNSLGAQADDRTTQACRSPIESTGRHSTRPGGQTGTQLAEARGGRGLLPVSGSASPFLGL